MREKRLNNWRNETRIKVELLKDFFIHGILYNRRVYSNENDLEDIIKMCLNYWFWWQEQSNDYFVKSSW